MKYFISVIAICSLCSSVRSRLVNNYIPNFDEEVELFKGKEVWFPDSKGDSVQVTFEPLLENKLSFDVSGDINFELFTRQNRYDYQLLNIDDVENLAKSHFDASKPTRFFAHGWRSNSGADAATGIRDAYLEREDCNVILIDWNGIAKGLYTIARIKMPSVGRYVAAMIDFLADNGMNLNTTTLIGHSLGAHVIGLAGSNSKNKVNFAVGLDPAWPLYALCTTKCRITSESAKIVEVIHTNGGFLGNPFPLGDVDFYPNGGGPKQPGCQKDTLGGCAHVRAVEFYIESILTETGFYGIACQNDKLDKCDGPSEIMGGIVISKKAGIYYLETREANPFAMGNVFDENNNL